MARTEDRMQDRSGSSVINALPGITEGELLGQPIQDRLDTVLSVIKRILKCEAVGIRLIDEDGNATYQVQDGFPEGFPATCQSVSLYRDDCACTRLLNRQSGPGASFYNKREPFMAGSACEFRSVLLCRIFYMDLNLGLIHCADTRPQRFSSQSARLLEELAMTIGRSLFYDSLWLPANWVWGRNAAPSHAVCAICGKFRDEDGRWFAERRLKPRISWSVLRVPRVVCPCCLQFSTVE